MRDPGFLLSPAEKEKKKERREGGKATVILVYHSCALSMWPASACP
jgi:hypothetical protein